MPQGRQHGDSEYKPPSGVRQEPACEKRLTRQASKEASESRLVAFTSKLGGKAHTFSRDFIPNGLLHPEASSDDDTDNREEKPQAKGVNNSPLFHPDPYDDVADDGSDSDKENFPPAYIPLLTYTDRHEIGEWLCRLARYHDQIAEALREGIDLMFALKAIADPPSRDTRSNNARTTPRARRTSAQASPREDRKRRKGKGRPPRQSPTPPSPIEDKMLSPLWEPRTIESPLIGALFGNIGGLACESGFRTEAGPSRIAPRENFTVNTRPAPVVEKTPTIADLYDNEQKRKADRKAAEAARATRNKRLRSK